MHNTFIKKNITIIAFCTLFSTATSPSWGKSTPAAVLQTVKSFLSKDMGKKALKIGLPAGGLAILAGLTGYGVKKVIQRRRGEEEQRRTVQKKSQQKLEEDLLCIKNLKQTPSSFDFLETPFVQNLTKIRNVFKRDRKLKKGPLETITNDRDFSGEWDAHFETDLLLRQIEALVGSYTGTRRAVQELNYVKDLFVSFFCALGAKKQDVEDKFDKAIESMHVEEDKEKKLLLVRYCIIGITSIICALQRLFIAFNARQSKKKVPLEKVHLSIKDLLSSAHYLLGFDTLGDISKIDASQKAKDFFAFIFTLLYELAKKSTTPAIQSFMQNVHTLEEFKNLPIEGILTII